MLLGSLLLVLSNRTICGMTKSSLDEQFPCISLLELIRRLLLAAQRGRAVTDDGEAFYDKWELVGPPVDVSHEFGDGYFAWGVAFEGERLHGVRLIMVPKTILPPDGCPIFCVYGCTKFDSPRWFSSHP